MKHSYAKPHPRLAEYVRTVLILEGGASSGAGKTPVFTNGMPTLICKTEKTSDNFEGIVQLSLFAKSPADIWAVDKNTTIIACFFKPFALACLFNIDAKKLSDRSFDLSGWNPHRYNALKTQLIYANDRARKMEVLDHLLIQQLIENHEVCKVIQYATDQMMNESGREILSQILEYLNLNERTFQRIFKKFVGITPTHYRRICQFQRSFGQLKENGYDKISEVAYDNGFADQSHFNRSFKAFTQVTPNEYLKKGLKNKKS